ncbi:MAG: zinc-dependent alcohol dehydrogenase [Clostridia bacterium]
MLAKTMNALQLNASNDLEYCEVSTPSPGPFEVICRVESVSICGTDPHIINGDFPGMWPKAYPIILGHEWAGVIVELGEKSGDFGWRVGDRVCAISHVGCGQCAMCLEGRYTLCLNYGKEELGHRQYGHYTQGAYAQYMCTAVKAIAKIPDEMDFNLAACMDPLSIALHVMMRSGIQPGDSVLINGAGAQGLMSIICAKSMGAGKIMVSGSGSRLEAAGKMGAITIDYSKEEVAARVKELTGGLGAKRVIECSGTEAGVRQACDAVAKGGCVSVVSLPKDDVKIPLRKIVLEEIDFVGNRANPNTLEKSIPIGMNYAKEINSMITHEFPLSKYKEAFDIFNGRKENSLKVVMKPQL